MPIPTKDDRRRALEALGAERLRTLADAFEITVEDRRSKAILASTLADARRVGWSDVLAQLKRAELQAMCAALGIEQGGRELDGYREALGGIEPAGPARPVIARPTKQASPARAKKSKAGDAVQPTLPGDPALAYRHEQKRLNNPPAGLVEFDQPPAQPKKTYAYDPHLDPQLQWAGKTEHTSFEVDTVSLHIQESVSAQAILRAVKREDVQRDLFAQPELDDAKQVEFYAHEVGWRNRLVLGDSLLVMNSLLERERMAGQVQCIYVDPPYGVKFNSNFQPAISRRDVKDGDDGSLTREPEQIQAYRDTWTLGIHSYLTYLRDRLLLARELLNDTGSVFVQISDDNLHHVRELMDEVFGASNYCSTIVFRTTSSANSPNAKLNVVASVADYILWYARDFTKVRYRPLFEPKGIEDDEGNRYTRIELADGTRRTMTAEERANPRNLPAGSRIYRHDNLTSQTAGETTLYSFKFEGTTFSPGKGGWKTNEEGMHRLARVGRLAAPTEKSLAYVRFIDDFPCTPYSNVWTDTQTGAFTEAKNYVVQTNVKVVQRCILMTTDPGDLVLDPTCGSGTTAYVAEQWGRRWITCDTSRVAFSIARQRLLTAKFPFFKLRGNRLRDGFVYKTVPHITLKSIAQNPKLDECTTREEMERVIRTTAEQETLYDQPEEDRGRVRVSGPFTVEAIPVASVADDETPSLPADAHADDLARNAGAAAPPPAATDFVGYMLDQLKKTGVHFKTKAGTKHLPLAGLRPVQSPFEYLHAEAGTGIEGDARRVAISFGPKHGPVTAKQVVDAMPQVRDYDLVLFVGFACDPEALKVMDTYVSRREMRFVQAAPDILVTDLLKTTRTTRLFTVFGLPDVKLHKEEGGLVSVELTGVDLYDPHTGETSPSEGESAAAWFVDQDYDGRTFCVSQAFFPARTAKNPWEKLQKALRGSIDEDRFEALRGTRSLPFKPGGKIAVKVVDDRGNEVMKVVSGNATSRSAASSHDRTSTPPQTSSEENPSGAKEPWYQRPGEEASDPDAPVRVQINPTPRRT